MEAALWPRHRQGFKPVKWFSIDRVFRNESLDATHLAEFHQVEGVIADYGLSLGDLIGVMEAFFNKLGRPGARPRAPRGPAARGVALTLGCTRRVPFLRPRHLPAPFQAGVQPVHRAVHGGVWLPRRFAAAPVRWGAALASDVGVRPGCVGWALAPGLNKWIELGNSGMFRPEMLRPMGLPETVTVIAWGISLERPTMIKYKYNNIRDLCGHKVNLQMVQDNPMCRLDKN